MSVPGWLAGARRDSPWPQLRAVVAGIGVSGFAAADALVRLGAAVTVVDERNGDAQSARARVLEVLGATVRLGPGWTATLPAGTGLVVTSPGWRPASPLLVAAARGG
ncbi:MAG: UDP-N-acetylmuramoyl-L-alanine--D-glutamate ligase, partial [Jiangellaceae bacterium]